MHANKGFRSISTQNDLKLEIPSWVIIEGFVPTYMFGLDPKFVISLFTSLYYLCLCEYKYFFI